MRLSVAEFFDFEWLNKPFFNKRSYSKERE